MRPWTTPLHALVALVAASALVSPAPIEGNAEVLARAKALFAERDFRGTVAILQERLKRSAGDVAAHEMLGRSLMELSRNDEAAHHLEIAWRRARTEGAEDRARPLSALLVRADPLATKRQQFFERVVDTLCDSAEELSAKGHAERALELVERLPPAASPGKDAGRVERLLENLRARFNEVRLDDAAGESAASGALPEFEHESERYRFACRLEPEVVKRLGTVMDDIHAFYVQVYFDGDAKKAAGPKPTIRVHADKASMLKDWSGGSAPEGWWSPGSNEVITYDTRNTGTTRRGSLDAMLVTLFHEASHQFMTLLARGGSTPAWLNEGTASFFEGTTAMADGRVLWPQAAIGRLRSLVASLQAGTPTARATVAYAEPGSYGAEYYAFGWGLVYFLQEYEDPATLEYVYRPLYAEYRSRVIAKGGDPLQTFEEVFLGRRSPLGHVTFTDFERDWKAWITGVVDPLNGSDERARRLRMERVATCLSAADAAKSGGKSRVSESELLSRALGHIEYVRARIDGEARPSGDLLLLQADVLERLKRTAATAPLLEQVLDLADAGKFALDPARYEAIGKRLAKLDQKNATLRATRARVSALARSGAALVQEYRTAKPPLVLRGYTFAALAGATLRDESGLAAVADALRDEARAQNLLLGTIHDLGRNPARWATISITPPKVFRTEGGVTELECVRHAAFVDLDVPVTGEYAWRGRIVRTGEIEMGSSAGAVIAGNLEGEWTLVGVNDRGDIGVWRLDRSARNAANWKLARTLRTENPIDPAQELELEIHVRRDRSVAVRVGKETVTTTLALDPEVSRHVGVFAKNASVRFVEPTVEVFP